MTYVLVPERIRIRAHLCPLHCRYRADGCLAKMTHGILDFITISCVIIAICLTAFPLTSIIPPECYLDGENGWQDMGVCNSVYIVSGTKPPLPPGIALSLCCLCYSPLRDRTDHPSPRYAGLSLLVAFCTTIIHCFTCCLTRLGFLVEAIGEIAQAVMWCIVSLIWDDYGTPSASPGVPRDFADAYNSVKNQREAVLHLGYVIVACTVFQACIATYRFVAACCCGKKGDDYRA